MPYLTTLYISVQKQLLQCSELCGIKHAFMPITVEVVSEDKYKEWLDMAKVKYAMYPENNLIVKKEK